MRRLTREIKQAKEQQRQLENIDAGMAVIHGRKFNESKIAALKSFLVVAERAERFADRCLLNSAFNPNFRSRR